MLLSSTRARAVPDVDIPATPLSEKSGRPRRDALIGAIGDVATLAANKSQGADLQGVYGELADDMTALYRYRADTVTGLSDAVAELVQAVNDAKKKAVAPVPREEHEKRVAEVEKEKKKVMHDIVEYRQKTLDANEELEELERRGKSLEAKGAAAQRSVREALPVLDARLKVYSIVAKAKLYEKNKWSDGVEECSLEGFVSDKARHDVRPFRFCLVDRSRSEGVNALWDLM